MTKRKVIDHISDNLRYEIEDEPLSTVLERLQKWVEEYGPDAVLEIEAVYDSVRVTVSSRREETDEEYNARIHQDQQRAAREAERERKEFERLKAKFEGANK